MSAPRRPFAELASLPLRVALGLAPPAFRDEFASEIERDFAEGLREARARGFLAALGFGVRMTGDVARAALLERWEERKRLRPGRTRARRSMRISSFGQDLRSAWRGLRKSPTFTLVALTALALGIGANTAIFSVVNAVLLNPLPYERSDELVRLWSSWTQFPRGSVSEPEYYDYRNGAPSIEEMGAFSFPHEATLAIEGAEPQAVRRTFVTASLFRALRVSALRGRTLRDEDNEPGGGDVVLLSHRLWQRAFGESPEVLGKRIRVEASPYTVVGVLPEWFSYPDEAIDLWLPLTLSPADPRGRGAHFLRVVARRKPDAAFASVRAELDVVAQRLSREYPESYPEGAGFSALVLPFEEEMFAEVRPALFVLLGAVGFVLLIACANVANLLLARAASRDRELAVRRALGASRAALIRQLLTESVVLAVASGLVSLAVAYGVSRALVALAPAGIPRIEEVRLDATVLGYAFALSVATGLLFGIAPAWRAARAGLGRVLGAGTRRSIGSDGRRVQRLLLVTEVSLAVTLLIGAGLLLRSFWNLTRVEPGLDTQKLVTARISLPDDPYPDDPSRVRFFERLRSELAGLAGVEAVALTSNAPFSGFTNDRVFYVEGADADLSYSGSEEDRYVSPEYFQALGIPLLAGRELDVHDDVDSPPVAVVSESFAKKYWPREPPREVLGKRIKLGTRESDLPWITVVGVAGDVRHSGLGADVLPTYYICYLQQTDRAMTLLVRAKARGEAIVASLRDKVHELDPNLAVFAIAPMEQLVSSSVAAPRFNLVLLGWFAALALALAAVGIYGLTRYAVGQRTGEIGLRVALGATRGEVLALVLREGLSTAGLGLVLGLLAAALLTRLLASWSHFLYGVAPLDPWTYVGVGLLLGGVVLAACWAPASRAAGIAPVEALRYE